MFQKYGKDPNYYFQSFGNKNKDKIFFLIKIHGNNGEGGGLFSNLLFILNHLRIADKFSITQRIPSTKSSMDL